LGFVPVHLIVSLPFISAPGTKVDGHIEPAGTCSDAVNAPPLIGSFVFGALAIPVQLSRVPDSLRVTAFVDAVLVTPGASLIVPMFLFGFGG
jgi:hypothetical protein